VATTAFSHFGITCSDPLAVERWYTKHFGFTRARVYAPGEGQVVMLKRGDLYLELFPAAEKRSAPPAEKDGTAQPGWRHMAFLVDDLEGKLAQMGGDARVNLGPIDFSAFVPGMRAIWLADPEGNVVELNQGYVDEANPPALDAALASEVQR
jgi:glyoxylase I family protein